MKIVTSNEILMAMVPNVVITVEGEKPLFEKVSHQMDMVEDWVADTFTGAAVLEDIASAPSSDIWRYTASLVVAEALRRAIPSLDVVLTPNGFGIVSNQNVAPASKDRIERLIQRLAGERDTFICMLVGELTRLESWRPSQQCSWFAATLLQQPKACVLGVYDRIREGQMWDQFLQVRERAILIEDAIAEKWISPEVMAQLRSVLITGNDPAVFNVALKVRSCVFSELRGNPRNHWDLDRILNYIRNNTQLFPAWESSETARLYNQATVFRNKKNSSGYFF